MCCLFEQVKFTKSSKGSSPSGHGHPKVAGHVGQAVQVIVVALRVWYGEEGGKREGVQGSESKRTRRGQV